MVLANVYEWKSAAMVLSSSRLARLCTLMCALLALAASATPSAQSGHLSATGALVLTNARVIRVATGEVQPATSIVIRGDTITAVVPDGSLDLSDARKVVDVQGAYVAPGLWDSHVHVVADPEFAISRQFAAFAAHGVTSLRDMGSTVEELGAFRAQMARQEPGSFSPRVIASGPLIDGVKQSWYGDLQRVVADPADVAPLLDELDDAGSDFYKAYSSLSAPAYTALLREAQLRGKPVDGHVPNVVGLGAVAAGSQRTIEHLDIAALRSCASQDTDWGAQAVRAKFGEGWESYYRVLARFAASLDWQMCRASLEEFGARGGAFTPTLIMEAWGPNIIDDRTIALMKSSSREYCSTQLASIRRASAESKAEAEAFLRTGIAELKAAGITILAGTDLPNYCNAPGASLLSELEFLVEFGLTPREALAAATIAPARLFLGQSGEIEPGARADLLVLGANPLKSIRGLRDLRGLLARGNWFDGDALAAFMDQAGQPS